MSSTTPIFSFETPTRERGSSSEHGSCRGIRSARELLRHIDPPEAEDASVDMPLNTPNTEHGTERPDRGGGLKNTVTSTLNPPTQRGERSTAVAGTRSNETEMWTELIKLVL